MGEIAREVLKLLEEAGGEYVSGSLIARRLKVTRAAVSKAVAKLRKRGFIIESHPKLGYRLVACDDLSRAQSYVSALGTRVRYTLHYLPSTTSTQDVAKTLAEHGAPEGAVVVAEEMSAGRGRLGRKWHAGPGGLWLTVLLRPQCPPARIQLFSILAGVAAAQAIEEICGIKPEIKWPNDVLLKGRKVCGVLVEVSAEADAVRYLLLGVGINVNNELPEELKEIAISLKEVVGKTVPRLPLLLAFLSRLDDLYEHLKSGDDEFILKEWRGRASTLGKRVRVICYDEVVEGTAVDIARDGSLLLKMDDGSMRTIQVGDVIHLR